MESFVQGTLGFGQVSGITQSLIDGNITQGNLDSLNSALLNVQNSGWLVKNAYTVNTEGLVNIGTNENAVYFPARLTEGETEHLVTNYSGLRVVDPKKGITNHSGIDIGNIHDNDYVAAADGSSLNLTWDKTWGLSAVNSFTIGGMDFKNNIGHMNPEGSIMSYLAAFGSEGITATSTGLTGIPAGMIIGQVGSSGNSIGQHLDLRTYQNSLRVDPLKSDIYGSYLSTIPSTFEARMLSNLSGSNTVDAWDSQDNWNRFKTYVYETKDYEWLWDLGWVPNW